MYCLNRICIFWQKCSMKARPVNCSPYETWKAQKLQGMPNRDSIAIKGDGYSVKGGVYNMKRKYLPGR